jgi:hypothetical protein
VLKLTLIGQMLPLTSSTDSEVAAARSLRLRGAAKQRDDPPLRVWTPPDHLDDGRLSRRGERYGDGVLPRHPQGGTSGLDPLEGDGHLLPTAQPPRR